jgi:hypothetical protein
MALMTLIAIGATSAVLSATPGPLDTPATTLVAIGMVWICCLGIPAAVLFDQKEDEQDSLQPVPPRTYDDAAVSEPSCYQPSSPIYEEISGETVCTESVETAAEVEKRLQEERMGDYSYRGEMPRRKRRDENLGK